MNTTPHLKRIRGFTLVEIMVTVAVLAILAGVAAPAFQNMIAASRVTAVTNELLELVALAQSEARNRQVTVGITVNSDTWSVTPGADPNNVLATLQIDANKNVKVESTFTNISFQPDGALSESTTSKSIKISSTSSYTSTARNIEILGGGKVILVNQ